MLLICSIYFFGIDVFGNIAGAGIGSSHFTYSFLTYLFGERFLEFDFLPLYSDSDDYSIIGFLLDLLALDLLFGSGYLSVLACS